MVWIDHVKVGHITSGKEETFIVNNERHFVSVSMDWCKSKPVEILANQDFPIKLKVHVDFSIKSFINMFLKPSMFFRLIPDDSI